MQATRSTVDLREIVMYDLINKRIACAPRRWAGDITVTGPVATSFTKESTTGSGDLFYRDGWPAPCFPGDRGIEKFSVLLTEGNLRVMEEWLRQNGDYWSAWMLRALLPKAILLSRFTLHERVARRLARFL